METIHYERTYYSCNERISSITPYVKGKKNGVAKWFYEKGGLKWEAHYKDDKKHGIEKLFYENGAIFSKTPYVNGSREGIEETYYPNGRIKCVCPFKNGEIEGVEEWYYESGEIMKKIVRKAGMKLYQATYSENGEKIKETIFSEDYKELLGA